MLRKLNLSMVIAAFSLAGCLSGGRLNQRETQSKQKQNSERGNKGGMSSHNCSLVRLIIGKSGQF